MRDVASDFVEPRYGTEQPGGAFKGCSSYVDFRELLDTVYTVSACVG